MCVCVCVCKAVCQRARECTFCVRTCARTAHVVYTRTKTVVTQYRTVYGTDVVCVSVKHAGRSGPWKRCRSVFGRWVGVPSWEWVVWVQRQSLPPPLVLVVLTQSALTQQAGTASVPATSARPRRPDTVSTDAAGGYSVGYSVSPCHLRSSSSS